MSLHTGSVLFLIWACFANARAVADNPAFMMVSGISASEEMCLTAANDVELEPCATAVAAGDGRELWQHLPDGQIADIVGEKCMGTDGIAVVLVACDGGGSWETRGNGQLQLGSNVTGHQCLSQQGSAAGVEDAALHGAISASSTADAAAHGANMAVDGSSSTFWASVLDPSEPVSITMDLGAQKKLSAISIDWEFAAKAFIVSVSTGGEWSEVYAADSNVMSFSRITLGAVPAKKIRLVMHEAAGAFHGHAVYGVKTLAVYAKRLQSIVADCDAAARSTDARDKYFATYVREFVPCSSKALRSQLPSLEAARTGVAAIVSQLAETLPKLSSCHGASSFAETEEHSVNTLVQMSHAKRRASLGNAVRIERNIDRQNGLDTLSVGALLEEARRVIVAARSALF